MPIINSSSIAETKNITENGIYDVTRYTSADVNVEGTQPVYTRINISPSTNSGSFYPKDFGADGFSEVSLNAVTSDIDSNIQAENIKKDVTILGVTGNYEGSGGSITSGVSLSISGNPNNIVGWANSDDWDTRIGETIEIMSVSGDTNRIWLGGMGRWSYAPFTISSATNNNGVCTLDIIDSKNFTYSLQYIKNNIAFTRYCTRNGNAGELFAPITPKVGDQVCSTSSTVSREELINGTGNIVYFSNKEQLRYYDVSTMKSASGPITITEVKYLSNGFPSIKLQDVNGDELHCYWATPCPETYVWQNGVVNVLGYEKLNINVSPSGGTMYIDSNGTYDIRDYEEVEVDVAGSDSGLAIKLKNDDGYLHRVSSSIDLSGVTTIGYGALRYAFSECYSPFEPFNLPDFSAIEWVEDSGLEYAFSYSDFYGEIDFGSLTNAGVRSFYQAFAGSGITGANFGSLEFVDSDESFGYAFDSTNIQYVNFDVLERIGSYEGFTNYIFDHTFCNCADLSNVDFGSLTTIVKSACAMSYIFADCTSLTSFYFYSLSEILNSEAALSDAFYECTSLTDLYFPALSDSWLAEYTDQFGNMLENVDSCTVHFPANLESFLASNQDVQAGFGGTNTQVLFDLPSTTTLPGVDGNSYIRNPKFDTMNSLSWRLDGTSVKDTAYYTSGTADPVWGMDYIFGDPECTQIVTQIAE